MRKAHAVAASMAALMLGQTGCYRTSIVTNLRPEPLVHQDRQWFTAAGLLPVSSPPGSECKNGIAWAQSRATPSDFFIQAGLAVAGAFIGSAVCAGGDRTTEEQGNCAAIGLLVPTLLVGSRTVAYSCASQYQNVNPRHDLGSGPETPARVPDPANASEEGEVPALEAPTPPPLPPPGSVPDSNPGL
ncbi:MULTISPECIES: hypothetical protein [unclassified Corallococcus]|uniref:hypothetical protein n=1 Tax=unclassified Corallococcus TaxID=2685029 RepID=UPI001A8DA2B0|nr:MULTISPECIES: hypothetical protein [unclassified Corallococcus]MBN9682174.1 hypothetical protein [Corallococcus sp. NCSPR001]WAS86264.1 hypothetical protein O0N60_04660 [Corallococcus sp. NCRR]